MSKWIPNDAAQMISPNSAKKLSPLPQQEEDEKQDESKHQITLIGSLHSLAPCMPC